jgi:hypothetical protein
MAILCFSHPLFSQTVYTITADSVKLTGCDSSELIIQNHTQNVPGFLFNTGNGRTIFKHALQPIGANSYLLGADTLNLATNAWLQGGNSFGTTGILGTLDNNHLDLYTHDSARARLTNTGNLLIGTTTDNGYRLHTSGGGIFQDGGVYHKNYYTNTGNASFEMGSGYELYGIPHASGGYIYYLSGGLSGDFDAQWAMAIGNSSNKIMEIKDSLISTNQLLQINAGINLLEQNSYMQSPYVGFQYQSASDWNWALMNSAGQPNFMVTRLGNTVLGSTTDYNIKLQVTGSGYFSGDLGIGTLYPTAQLHTTGSVRFAGLTQDSTKTEVLVTDVNGNLYYRSASSLAADEPIRSSLAVNGAIKSKKIIISPDEWADYVFDSTYRLPNLTDVESYIHREHHLSGIPTAAAVQKDSLDIGASQAALLKKIEELTLYTIEQKKEIEALNARVEKLERSPGDKTKQLKK